MWLWTIGLLLAVVGLIYLKLTWKFDYWRKKGVKGPKPVPFLGSFPSALNQKQNSAMDLHEIYKAYKNDEDFVGIFSFGTPQLLVLNPSLIHRVFVADFKHFNSNMFANMSEPVVTIFSNNPFILSGEKWKEKRTEVSGGLTLNRIKSSYPVTKKVCRNLVEYMKEKTRIPPKDGIDAKDLCMRFTSDLVTDCVLGLDARSLSDRPTPVLDHAKRLFSQSFLNVIFFSLAETLPFITYFYKPRFVAEDVENFFLDLVQNAMKTRRELDAENKSQTRSDFLAYLLELQEKKNLSLMELTGHSMTFLLDGFETTALVMSHILLMLGRHPEVQEKLRKEIEKNVDASGDIDFELLNQLPYLDACIHESLRIFPPGLFSQKVCTEPIEWVNKNGQVLTLAKGDTVVLPTYSVMRDEEYYEDPEKFMPERFLEEYGGVKKYRDMGVYHGFGDGPRVCLGMRFALAQMKAALVQILRNFDVRINPKTRSDNRLYAKHFFGFLDGGVWLDIHPRDIS